jgi:hypothetical protein
MHEHAFDRAIFFLSLQKRYLCACKSEMVNNARSKSAKWLDYPSDSCNKITGLVKMTSFNYPI